MNPGAAASNTVGSGLHFHFLLSSWDPQKAPTAQTIKCNPAGIWRASGRPRPVQWLPGHHYPLPLAWALLPTFAEPFPVAPGARRSLHC